MSIGCLLINNVLVFEELIFIFPLHIAYSQIEIILQVCLWSGNRRSVASKSQVCEKDAKSVPQDAKFILNGTINTRYNEELYRWWAKWNSLNVGMHIMSHREKCEQLMEKHSQRIKHYWRTISSRCFVIAIVYVIYLLNSLVTSTFWYLYYFKAIWSLHLIIL